MRGIVAAASQGEETVGARPPLGRSGAHHPLINLTLPEVPKLSLQLTGDLVPRLKEPIRKWCVRVQ